ncbi:hypothetical protein YC2023_096718 [Brassica napus]
MVYEFVFGDLMNRQSRFLKPAYNFKETKYNLVTLFNFDFIAIRAIPKNIQTWFCVEQIPKSRKFYLLAGPTYLGNKKAKRNPIIYIFGIGPKTKKKKKPKVSVNKSILKKEVPRMSKAVTSQVCISLLL